MNPLNDMRQHVYVLNAAFTIDCIITDLQLQAKEKLAESKKAELALLNLRLQLRRSINEGFGVFGDEGETDER
nr:MAG TPA: hypothetical protein [Caudoviricetes sp.]